MIFKSTSTLKKILFFSLLFLCNFSFAQTFVNGNLSTGPVSSNNITAPSGFTWSEVQEGNESAGFSASIENQYSIVDDFTIPAGEVWNITNINLYAYSTGYAGTASPFNNVRIQIFSQDPSTGSPVPVFGDLSTNRYLSATSANMYRIFFGQTNPGNQRKIWEITASSATTLSEGHYWIEWQVGTITAGASNFMPSSTVTGTVTQPGNNALQHSLADNSWTQLLDGPNPQDMPFKVNYTTNCTNPTQPSISASQNIICVGQSSVLSISAGQLNNAANWEWYISECGGSIVGTGMSITVSPASTTTYFVKGVGGCVTAGECGQITITVNPCQCLTPDVASICEGSLQPLSVTQPPGSVFTVSSSSVINIPNSTDITDPYPSTINVTGLPSSGLAVKSVTINGVNHDWADDLDIVLVSPNGTPVVLMSDAGSFFEIFNADITFSDDATEPLPEEDEIFSGTYLPTNYGATDDFPAPGPGTLNQPNPSLSMFSGDVNGEWKLYILDDFIGFGGSVSGWSITFTSQTTASWSPAESLFMDAAGTVPYVSGTQAVTVYAAPSATTTYTADIISGPCQGNNTITVNVNPRPVLSLSPSSAICGPTDLNVSGAETYNWSPSAGLNFTTGNTVSANPEVNTTYTVTGTAANGCSSSASVLVNTAPVSAVLTGNAPGIVQLSENFDSGVPSDWTMVNNSDVVGINPNWSQGNPTVFPSHSGAPNSYVFANYQMSSGNFISSWLITKEVSISNGDRISFYTRTTDGTFPDRLELRLSISGNSTNVGSTPTSVGDFTTLLLAINPNLLPGSSYPSTWTRFEATVSGLAAPVSGRFAFRYWIENIDDNADYIGIDDITIETPMACLPANTVQNMSAAITGGVGPFSVVFTDGTTNTTINNYVSGSPIQISPDRTTTYTLVSVTGANGCAGSNLSGENIVVIEPVLLSAPRDTSLCPGGSAAFSISATGNNLNYQWQYSNDNGTTWFDVTGSEYSGQNTNELHINNGTAAMEGLLFRVSFGNSACGMQVSPSAELTLLPSPQVTITPGTYQALYPGLSTTISATSSPAAISYQWFLNGNAIPGATSSSYTVNVGSTGNYTVGATTATGCFGLSPILEIRDSANTNLFIYPSPTTGNFTVRYWAGTKGLTPEGVTIFDSKGSRLFTKHFSVATPYQEMKIDMTKFPKGIYWVELTDKNGKRIKTGRVIIQ